MRIVRLRSRDELDRMIGTDGPSHTFSAAGALWSCTASGDRLHLRALDGPRRSHLVLLGGRPEMGYAYSRRPRYEDRFLGFPMGQLLASSWLARMRFGLVVHAAAAMVDSRAFLFCGTSGAGKSTLSLLLRDHPSFRLLTDERAVLFLREGRLFASGSPWSGTAGIAERGEAPLAGVFFLRHAEENHVEPMSPARAAAELFRTCFPTFWYRPGMEFALEFCIRVAREVPCRVFGFRPDRSAAEFLLGVLEKEKSRC